MIKHGDSRLVLLVGPRAFKIAKIRPWHCVRQIAVYIRKHLFKKIPAAEAILPLGFKRRSLLSKTWRCLMEGVYANRQEAAYWNETSDPRVAPVIGSYLRGWIIIQPRGEAASKKDLETYSPFKSVARDSLSAKPGSRGSTAGSRMPSAWSITARRRHAAFCDPVSSQADHLTAPSGASRSRAPRIFRGAFQIAVLLEMRYHRVSMKLSIGIVGLPNVGKSTLFNALTKKSVPAENYPFCTIDPSVGVVAVPDDRLYKLADFSKTNKTIPAVVEFVDIAGLVKGASEGEGLGNQFLSHIREVNAIAEVVRIFEDQNIIHVDGKIHPVSDVQVINLELALADAQTVTKRLGSIERDVKRGDKPAVAEKIALEKVSKMLAEGELAQSADLTEEDLLAIEHLHLLTMKPIMYILNKKAGGTNLDESNDPRYQELIAYLEARKAKWSIVDAKVEHELMTLQGEEKEMFRSELGVKDDGINGLITTGYDLLSLQTYFTTGVEETRAWTIEKGWTAPLAGTAIHTDFKDKFVRAEIIGWKELLDSGSYPNAREKGLVRTEGKEYVMRDGDVVEFKI